MRIHHVNCATMCPPLARWINGEGRTFGPARMVCHCLLVETNDGLALVDTGLGTGDIDDPKGRLGGGFVAIARPKLDRAETALAQVEALGLKREDVRHILPTHLDLDHAGGLSDFPDAKVHIFKKEHAAALDPPTFAEKERYRRAHFVHEPKWEVHDTGGDKWLGFDSVRALGGTNDRVLLVPLTGHSRGHCGIAVETDGGWLLHAGDAYFFHGEVHADPPHCPPGLLAFQRFAEIDHDTRIANQRRLRELARDHGKEVRIFSAHCPVEYEASTSSA